MIYTGARKDPPGRDFLRQISMVFGNFLKKYLRYRNFMYLIWKPLYTAIMSQKDKEGGVSIWQPESLEWNSNFFH